MAHVSYRPRSIVLWVNAFTLTRALAAWGFVCIAFQPQVQVVAVVLYIYAFFGDLLDGFVARRFRATTPLGAVLDGFSDKYISVLSALYLVSAGYSLPACGLIVFRDTAVSALRLLRDRDSESLLLSPKRWVGVIVGTPIKLITLAVLLDRGTDRGAINLLIWIAAVNSVIWFLRGVWIERLKIASFASN